MTAGKRVWLSETQWVYEQAIHYKDPNDSSTHAIDWALFLGVDTIQSVAWTLQSGITQASASNTTTTTTITLSGGTLGSDYLVTARITTASGRSETASLLVKVRDQ